MEKHHAWSASVSFCKHSLLLLLLGGNLRVRRTVTERYFLKKKSVSQLVPQAKWTYVCIQFLQKVLMVASGNLSLTHFFPEELFPSTCPLLEILYINCFTFFSFSFRTKPPGWYWGSMTVNEAKEKLKEAPEGTFLIRDSSHSDYLLTISVKTSAGPTNLRIEYQDGKFRLDSIICVKSKLKQFDSVVHLIDYYVQMCKDKRTGPEAPRNGTVHLYLTKPLYTSAPPLQHLCRLTINKCTGTIWGLPLPTRLKDYLEEYKFQV